MRTHSIISRFSLIAVLGAMLLSSGIYAGTVTLNNDQVSASWTTRDNTLWPDTIKETASGENLSLRGELFTLMLSTGEAIRASQFHLVGDVKTGPLSVDLGASRFSERLPGKQLTAEMVSDDGDLQVTWHAVLRDGSRYVREQFIFTAGKREVPLNGIMLLDTPFVGAHATGTVDGAPVMTETAFFGVEHPLSIQRGEMNGIRCYLPRSASLAAGESYAASLVIGFVTKGQARRDFLAYLERERAHPYRPFLHYNSWYDIGTMSKYDETAALNVINTFGEELHVKRGVKLDSFLFDDGWDDPQTLWCFDKKNFPDGFAKVRAAAEKYGAEPGIWLSPWGGYGRPHDQRIGFGKGQGFEMRDNNFTLAGPKYYERFRGLCVDVVKSYGINQFKFDGIGQNRNTRNLGAGGGEGGGAQRDFDAMLKLIGELRSLKSDLYINQTTGTWASPFWLLYADSIWRGGRDHSFVAGDAPERERWISYRDNETYDRVVSRSDLFPLNSLMLHGIIYAKSARGLSTDPSNAFRSEIRAMFGSGTQLQEMYITPALLSPQNWDDLAEGAKWSRANADILVDTHWIGGRPEDGQVYGWASWSPKKGIITLRNPTSRDRNLQLDPGKAFELPAGAAKKYSIVPAFPDEQTDVKELNAGTETAFKLKPFEVLVLEAWAVN